MGSGEHIKFWLALDCWGLGIAVTSFPFPVTIQIHFIACFLSVGFGTPSDKYVQPYRRG